MRRPSLEGIAKRFGVGTTPRYSGGSTRLYLPRRKSSGHTVSEFEELHPAISRQSAHGRETVSRRDERPAEGPLLPSGRFLQAGYSD